MVVPVVQLKEKPVQRRTEKQVMDVAVLWFQETLEVRMATPQGRFRGHFLNPSSSTQCFRLMSNSWKS